MAFGVIVRVRLSHRATTTNSATSARITCPLSFTRLRSDSGLKRLAARRGNPAEGAPAFSSRLRVTKPVREAVRPPRRALAVCVSSIQLISATDVARGRFEPDEFLDFLSGRLASAYISTATRSRPACCGARPRPDPDGRYRVNEFFCRNDAWQQNGNKVDGGERSVWPWTCVLSHPKGRVACSNSVPSSDDGAVAPRSAADRSRPPTSRS